MINIIKAELEIMREEIGKIWMVIERLQSQIMALKSSPELKVHRQEDHCEKSDIRQIVNDHSDL